MVCSGSTKDIASELREDLPLAFIALFIPTIFAYLSLHAFAKGWMAMFRLLTVVAILGFWTGKRLVVMRCAAGEVVFRAAGKEQFSFSDYFTIIKLSLLNTQENMTTTITVL